MKPETPDMALIFAHHQKAVLAFSGRTFLRDMVLIYDGPTGSVRVIHKSPHYNKGDSEGSARRFSQGCSRMAETSHSS